MYKYSIYVYTIGMKRSVVYPDWVEKYRGKGRTIRKVRDGYGLYQCTSVYDPHLKYPKSVQTYLGMITEKEGFIPKKSSVSDTPSLFLEYGLSHFIMTNFKRELVRSTYNGDPDVVVFGIISYIFGGISEPFIRATYITHGRESEFIDRFKKGISDNRMKKISNRINKLFDEKITDSNDRNMLEKLLLLAVIRNGSVPESVIYYPEVQIIAERYGLKL